MLGDILNKHGEKLDYNFFFGSENNRYILIIGNGLPGYIDHPLIDELCKKVSGEGLSVLSFSFSGNGNSQGRFTDSTISKRIEDLQKVISVVLQNGWRPMYAGHGLNSTIGVLASTIHEKIEFLVSMSGVLQTETYCQHLIEKESNYLGLENDPNTLDYKKIINELIEIKSIMPRARGIKIPWFLIHGSNDLTVPISDPQSLTEYNLSNPEIFEINGADHALSGKAIYEVSEVLINWLGRKIQIT